MSAQIGQSGPLSPSASKLQQIEISHIINKVTLSIDLRESIKGIKWVDLVCYTVLRNKIPPFFISAAG